MKQFILGVMLAITVGVMFVAYSGLITSAGAETCARVDAASGQTP
jgi:hypothetical protein